MNNVLILYIVKELLNNELPDNIYYTLTINYNKIISDYNSIKFDNSCLKILNTELLNDVSMFNFTIHVKNKDIINSNFYSSEFVFYGGNLHGIHCTFNFLSKYINVNNNEIIKELKSKEDIIIFIPKLIKLLNTIVNSNNNIVDNIKKL